MHRCFMEILYDVDYGLLMDNRVICKADEMMILILMIPCVV